MIINIRTAFNALLGLTLSVPVQGQSPLWADLAHGPYSVGFRVVDTADATRSFPSPNGVRARPMRLYLWYPAARRTGTALVYGDLVPLATQAGTVFNPVDPRAFARLTMRTRLGPSVSGLGDAAVDSLLRAPLTARRNAKEIGGRRPVILLSPGQPFTMPVAAEYLASYGFLVIGTARKAINTIESMSFTPNAASTEAETADLAFSLAYARGNGHADASQVGLLGYSSSGISNLSFAMQSRAARAAAVFEGWEGYGMGQPIVQSLPAYDPRAFRAWYLLIEKSTPFEMPGGEKSSQFIDSMRFSPRWRITFDSAEHPDFASPGVALKSPGSAMRRNFTRSHELLRDFFLAALGNGRRRWDPADETGVRVRAFTAENPVPTDDEFFHLAETNPAAADSAAAALARQTPPTVPFSESGLTRLALLTRSRRPADAARIYGIVLHAFPRSTSAAVGLSDALADAGQASAARSAAQRALELIRADTILSDQQKSATRARLELRVAP